MVFAEHDSWVPVQIKRSLYEDLSLASSPGPAGTGSEDLSRASAAFGNKLVGETELCIYSGGSPNRQEVCKEPQPQNRQYISY